NNAPRMRPTLWRELFTRAASAKGGASKQLAPHQGHLFLKDHIAYIDGWHSTTGQRSGGVGACSGRHLLLPFQLITDREDQGRLTDKTIGPDRLEQYFVIANEGDPLQSFLVRLDPFLLPGYCFSLYPQIRQRDIFITDNLRPASISFVADM